MAHDLTRAREPKAPVGATAAASRSARRLALIACTAWAAACVAPVQARTLALDAVPVPLDRVDGFRPHELSGLAWDRQSDVLYAASDRGVLFAWRFEVRQDRIERFSPLWARALAPHGQRLNAEALDMRAAPEAHATLVVADESGATAWLLDPASMTFDHAPWPAGLARGLPRHGAKHGVEALASSPRWGSMAALQRPSSTNGPHEIHAEHAPHAWLLDRTSSAGSAVKAVEDGPGRLVTVLERTGRGADVTHRLRRFDPDGCRPDGPCLDHTLELTIPASVPRGLNWEGLACRADRTCVVVSDDGDVPGHGWLMLLRLPEGLDAPHRRPTAPHVSGPDRGAR